LAVTTVTSVFFMSHMVSDDFEGL